MIRPSNEKLAMIENNAIIRKKILRVLDALKVRTDINQENLATSRQLFELAFFRLDTSIISK